MTGIVKRLKLAEGFGFIKDDEDGTEWFFHRSALVDGVFHGLRENVSRVRFDPGQGPKGPRAERVEVL